MMRRYNFIRATIYCSCWRFCSAEAVADYSSDEEGSWVGTLFTVAVLALIAYVIYSVCIAGTRPGTFSSVCHSH